MPSDGRMLYGVGRLLSRLPGTARAVATYPEQLAPSPACHRSIVVERVSPLIHLCCAYYIRLAPVSEPSRRVPVFHLRFA